MIKVMRVQSTLNNEPAEDARQAAIRRVGVLALLAVLAAGAAASAASVMSPSMDGLGAPPAGVAAARGQEVEELTLTLRPEGFTPAEVTRAAGRYQLSVDNCTELKEEFAFRLSRDGGSLVREMRVERGTVDWSELIDLTAGSYTLTETRHTEWVCRLTITDN